MKNKTVTGCHNCPYNGKKNDACLKCTIIQEEYNHPYTKYILPTYDAPEIKQNTLEKATGLNDDEEDILRKKLYDIFDLDFIELILLKCIMNNMSLTEFSQKFNDFMDYNNKKKKKMTRFCAFQIRKRMVNKLGKIALLTKGQKKVLKERE